MTDWNTAFIAFKALHADRSNHTSRGRRVGVLTRIIGVASLLMLLAGSIMTIVSWAELNSAGYKYNVRKYDEYNGLYIKYTTVDLTIAERRGEARAEDAHTKARIRELRVKDEESGRKQWQDFDTLTAYYSQSDVRYEQLQQMIDDCNVERSAYSNRISRIKSSAGETREVGCALMWLGGALSVLGLIRLLRELQLLGRFSRMTRYCA